MINAAEVTIETAADGLRPSTGPELAGVLAELPGIFTDWAKHLGELAAWAAELTAVQGNPGELITAIASPAQSAASAAQECCAAFYAANEFWLENQDCRFEPAIALAEDASHSLVPHMNLDGPAGYALADLLDSLAELTELVAEQLAWIGEWAGEQHLAGAEGIDAIAGFAQGMAAAADEAISTYYSSNPFWLDARE